MQQISSVLGQAEAAMHAGDPERAAMLHLKAANLCVAARDVLKSHADAFDPSTSAFLASQEWKLAHPDSAHVFDQVVDLLLKDNASPDTHPSTHP